MVRFISGGALHLKQARHFAFLLLTDSVFFEKLPLPAALIKNPQENDKDAAKQVKNNIDRKKVALRFIGSNLF